MLFIKIALFFFDKKCNFCIFLPIKAGTESSPERDAFSVCKYGNIAAIPL